METIVKMQQQCKDLHVLYVEDDRAVREQFFELLTLIFDDITVCFDGEEAWQHYQGREYDLVITDIEMPRMNGLELIKEIRKNNAKQKIIITSAYDSVNYLVETIVLHVDAYLFKPIDYQQFERTLFKVTQEIVADKLLHNYYEELEKEVAQKTKQIAQEALIDTRTGLFNRRALEKHFNDTKKRSLMLINIDNFDAINITYGYFEGNAVIEQVAAYLKEKAAALGVGAYYLYADEFVLFFEETIEPKRLASLAEEIQEEIAALAFDLKGHTIHISVSIAIASGESVLLENAHMALKEARQRANGSISFYKEDSPIKQQQLKIQHYMPIVRGAIDKNEITPYFQPIINNATGAIAKFEALARIESANDVTYTPAHFIDVAKMTGMLPNITKIMIDKTFHKFQDNGMKFSINISEDDLNDKTFIPFLEDRLQHYAMEPSRVILEVLEGVSTEGVDLCKEHFCNLKLMGLGIAIDDFGTENSNFERVHNMNVDYIKIDGKYIKDIDTNTKSYQITKSITDFAKSIGAAVIAEFVHSKEVHDIVVELGIEYSQGYYFAQPQKEILHGV